MKSIPLLIRGAVLCAALLLVSLPAAGQGTWWRSEEFKKELGLTAEQTRRCEEIFQKAMPKLKALKSALDEADGRFARLLERGEDSAIMEQVNIVAAARSELEKARTTMLLDMKKLLTTDQWAKFTPLQKQVMSRATVNRNPAATGTPADKAR